MATKQKEKIFKKLESAFGQLKNIGDGHSLFLIPSIDVMIYFRYSKISQASKNVEKAFYGLRKEDIELMILSGKKSFIYLFTNDETRDILIPLNHYESYFLQTEPSSDGQFKTLTYFKPTGAEIYFSNIGKFNAEGFFGLDATLKISQTKLAIPILSHHQVQSLIGAIGIQKGFDLWYPENDKNSIDTSIVDFSKVRTDLPFFNKSIESIICEIDVIWLLCNKPMSFWEVEHSTPIYSGLLRFNDILLTISSSDNFNIVASRDRESKFGREVNRPTFKQNKLVDKVAFVDYENIYIWYHNITGELYGI